MTNPMLDASKLEGWCAKCGAEAVLKSFRGGRLLVASPCDCDAGIVLRSIAQAVPAAAAPSEHGREETNE